MAVVFAVIASLCTATSSVCQRRGADHADTNDGFHLGLLLRLVRRPIWLLGVASMIAGFGFQVTALHFGDLALVQPILATELVFVFGILAVTGSRRVARRDWMAAVAMASGLGLFLFAASPSGGSLHAEATSWLLAAAVSCAVVAAATIAAFASRHGAAGDRTRRAAILGAATGVSWGFVAAIIKELSSHTSGGFSAVFSNWSPYALLVAGAASMIVASHALAAGPLAASQPGFTIVDPLTASLLGLFIFGEHIRLTAAWLALEVVALALVVGGVSVLSHSRLVRESSPEAGGPDPGGPVAGVAGAACR
ncbi:MAG: DMT family transporter [Acidimicrobiales bacterium]